MPIETNHKRSGSRGSKSSLSVFLIALAALIVLRLIIGFVAVPMAWVPAASMLVSVFFVATPILAFFYGSSYPWNWKQALALLLGGAICQIGFFILVRTAGSPFLAGLFNALSQTGLLLWVFGLGVLLATIIRDRNIILPVAVAGALFDIWLVFAPEGVAHRAVQGPQRIIGAIAFQLPQPQVHSAGGFARPLAYVGPADFMFLTMFFTVLFKFQMKTRQTLWAMIPTLAAYLLVVLVFGNESIGPFRLGALPALVPIGLVVLLVNFREFRLTRQEAIATVLVAVIGFVLVTWRLVVSTQRERQAELSQTDVAPDEPAVRPTPEQPQKL